MKHGTRTRTRKGTRLLIGIGLNRSWVHYRQEYYSVIHCTQETNPTIHLNNTAQLITPSSSSAGTTTPVAPVRTGRPEHDQMCSSTPDEVSNVSRKQFWLTCFSAWWPCVCILCCTQRCCTHHLQGRITSHQLHVHHEQSNYGEYKSMQINNKYLLLQRPRGHKP